MKTAVLPPFLKAGDTVRIVSPASIINPDYVRGAVKALEEAGFHAETAPHALGAAGSYAATAEERLTDLTDAFLDPKVSAILCSRGGYGCVHLLEPLGRLPLDLNPKWLIGFSDVSALHALMLSKGIASLHSSMAKALATQPLTAPANRALLSTLTGNTLPDLNVGPHIYNKEGSAEGQLTGGNLAVIQAFLGTPFSPFRPGSILYIEDIAEPIYKVERILYQLRLSGILNSLNGLIIGQFTEYKPDRNFPDMYSMISAAIRGLEIPVAFGFPIGHIEGNMPVVNGLQARLTVTPHGSTLTYLP